MAEPLSFGNVLAGEGVATAAHNDAGRLVRQRPGRFAAAARLTVVGETAAYAASRMAVIIIEPRPDPVLSEQPISHLADMLEDDFDQGRPLRPDVVWEVLRRAVIAEGADAASRPDITVVDVDRPSHR